MLEDKPVTKYSGNTIKPYKQGELDPLCGIYASINAIRWLCRHHSPISPQRAHVMFEEAAQHLASKRKLSGVLCNGMGDKTLYALLRHLMAYCADSHGVQLSASIIKQNNMMRDVMKVQLETQNVLLVRLKGVFDHFTVIHGFDDKRWFLYDSGGMSYVYHRSIKPSVSRKPSRYKFTANGVISISVK